MKTVAFIPARGGSVRVPRKNIRDFRGKPIIAYSIENAQKCGLFDDIYVSTDDAEIWDVAVKYGAKPTPRPTDDGSRGTQEIAGEFLRSPLGAKYGICCCLYATAPLLDWRHLYWSWQGLHSFGSCYVYAVDEDKRDVGALYWGPTQAFRENIPLDGNSAFFQLPQDRCCDINTEDDWLRAEQMYDALQGKA